MYQKEGGEWGSGGGKALFALCSGLYFQGHSYANSLGGQKVSSSRGKSRHTYCLLLVLEQRAGMLTAHKIPEIPNLRVFSTSKAPLYEQVIGPFLHDMWELRLRTLAQMNACTLATATALSNNTLDFISASMSSTSIHKIVAG